jgi:hypothetical protein
MLKKHFVDLWVQTLLSDAGDAKEFMRMIGICFGIALDNCTRISKLTSRRTSMSTYRRRELPIRSRDSTLMIGRRMASLCPRLHRCSMASWTLLMLLLDIIWLLNLYTNTIPSQMYRWNEELVVSKSMLALALQEKIKEKEEVLRWHCLSGWYRMIRMATVLDPLRLFHSLLVWNLTSLKLKVLLLVFVTLLLRSFPMW